MFRNVMLRKAEVSIEAPILSPFVLAALLGWLGDPMVDRLEARGLKRNNAVILVFSAMTLVLVIALIVLVPLLEQQVVTLVTSLPGYRDWMVGTALPWVEQRTGVAMGAQSLLDQMPGAVADIQRRVARAVPIQFKQV